MRPRSDTWVAARPLSANNLGLALFGLVCLLSSIASAHPLGNFSISHYSGIRIEPERVELRYLIDMAEIPTFQELQESKIVAEANHPTLVGYLANKAEALKQNLLLEMNGRRVALQAESKEVLFPEGAGGLPTLKLAINYRGRIEPGAADVRLRYVDRNYPDRVGWKEVVVKTGAGVNLLQSSAPERDRSNELSDYPADLLNSPPQDLEANAVFSIVAPVRSLARSATPFAPIVEGKSEIGVTNERAVNTSAAASNVPAASVGMVSPGKVDSNGGSPKPVQANRQTTPRNAFTELMATPQWSVTMLLFALVVAAGLGALHALEPGHGKTLVAAYLVGSRGTIKHALLLGSIVTVAHTAGVYLLGAVTLYASQYIVPEKLYPWLTLTSGLMILVLGCVLFLRRYRGDEIGHDHRGHGHGHSDTGHPHHHEGHSHGHSQGHNHGHHHHHHDAGREVSLKQLLTLGISGGIVPCPAALVVLLSAVSLHRVGFGLLLIVAFSVGLAAVLIGIGMLMVCAQAFAARFKGTGLLTTRWLPLTSSAFIVLFGVALTWQALQGQF